MQLLSLTALLKCKSLIREQWDEIMNFQNSGNKSLKKYAEGTRVPILVHSHLVIFFNRKKINSIEAFTFFIAA